MNKNHIKIALGSLLLAGAFLVFGPSSFSRPNGGSFQLFFTADLYGYLKPCG